MENRTAELSRLRSQVRQLLQRNGELERQLAAQQERCDALLAENQDGGRYRTYFDEVKRYLDDVLRERDQARAELSRQQELAEQLRELADSREASLRQALSQAYFERDQLRKLVK